LRRDDVIGLRMFERGIEVMRHPYWQPGGRWPISDDEMKGAFRLAPISAMFMPHFESRLTQIAQCGAHLALARCAITAYRIGAQAGVEQAARELDPFTGQQLHARIDPDGDIVFWSVGKDGVDDGGSTRVPTEAEVEASDYKRDPEAPLDMVWRLRLN
jgi:hypothetical protein